MALPAGDVRRLHGGDALYRLRVGAFRILFTRDEATATIAVINIGNRGDVYK